MLARSNTAVIDSVMRISITTCFGTATRRESKTAQHTVRSAETNHWDSRCQPRGLKHPTKKKADRENHYGRAFSLDTIFPNSFPPVDATEHYTAKLTETRASPPPCHYSHKLPYSIHIPYTDKTQIIYNWLHCFTAHCCHPCIDCMLIVY